MKHFPKFLSLLLLPFSLQGGLRDPPQSFYVFSEDQERVFVVIAPNAEHDRADNLITLPNGETGPVREMFPSSGVFDIDTMAKLWEIEIYGFPENFAVSGDLEYWAAVHWEPSVSSSIVLRIFHQSKETGVHDYDDLLAKPNHPMFLPNWTLGFDVFQFQDYRLVIKTSNRELWFFRRRIHLGGAETHVFDPNTGRLLSTTTEPRYVIQYMLLLAFILSSVLGGLCFALYRVDRWLRRK